MSVDLMEPDVAVERYPANANTAVVDMPIEKNHKEQCDDRKEKKCVRTKAIIAITAFGITILIMLVAALWGLDGLFTN